MEMEQYIPQIVATVVAVVVLWVSKFITRKLVARYGLRLQKAEIRRKQIRQVISIMLNIVFIFLIAVIWGVQPKNLLVGLSSVLAVLGVALFAQWSVLSNVTAGIIMFFGAPFRIGDHIRIVDKDTPIDAVVENIYTFYTHIRTDDDELIVIPNNVFLQKMVSIRKETKDLW